MLLTVGNFFLQKQCQFHPNLKKKKKTKIKLTSEKSIKFTVFPPHPFKMFLTKGVKSIPMTDTNNAFQTMLI